MKVLGACNILETRGGSPVETEIKGRRLGSRWARKRGGMGKCWSNGRNLECQGSEDLCRPLPLQSFAQLLLRRLRPKVKRHFPMPAQGNMLTG